METLQFKVMNIFQFNVRNSVCIAQRSNLASKALLDTFKEYMGCDMTKPTMWLCAQRRLRSAWASAQSDWSLRCPHEETLGP